MTANTASTVNVGNSNTVSGIAAPIAIYGPGSSTTVNINDASDTTHSTATLDNASGNMNASYEVTGLSPAAIEYGSGVTALTVNGGTFGASGLTYDVNNTRAATTTTINGGANADTFNLSSTEENLSGLAGPVVLNGNAADALMLNDQNGAGGTYTLDSTTASAPNTGGLTYGTIGSLTLNSSSVGSTINVNGTSVATTLNTGPAATQSTCWRPVRRASANHQQRRIGHGRHQRFGERSGDPGRCHRRQPARVDRTLH